MKEGFSRLGDLVRSRLQRAGLQGAVRERRARAVWAEVVGEKIAAVTVVDRVRDGVLYVNCRDSLWAQELHFLRPLIISKLNEELGAEVIKEIRLSGVGFRKTGRQDDKRAAQKQQVAPVLTDQEAAAIDSAAAKIEDSELAERVARGLRASRALRKRHESQG